MSEFSCKWEICRPGGGAVVVLLLLERLLMPLKAQLKHFIARKTKDQRVQKSKRSARKTNGTQAVITLANTTAN